MPEKYVIYIGVDLNKSQRFEGTYGDVPFDSDNMLIFESIDKAYKYLDTYYNIPSMLSVVDYEQYKQFGVIKIYLRDGSFIIE